MAAGMRRCSGRNELLAHRRGMVIIAIAAGSHRRRGLDAEAPRVLMACRRVQPWRSILEERHLDGVCWCRYEARRQKGLKVSQADRSEVHCASCRCSPSHSEPHRLGPWTVLRGDKRGRVQRRESCTAAQTGFDGVRGSRTHLGRLEVPTAPAGWVKASASRWIEKLVLEARARLVTLMPT
jgi:hypothetical protein